MKYELANDDRKADKIGFEKRLNQLIRDFVKVYKALGSDYKNYKDYVAFEMELLKRTADKK